MQMRTICGIISAACAALFIDLAAAVQQAAATPDDETTKVLKTGSGGGYVLEQIASLPVACTEVRPVEGRETSLLPEGMRFRLVWHDEFDGNSLDESKWSYRTNFWGRRAHWFATPEDGCVEVADGVKTSEYSWRGTAPDGKDAQVDLLIDRNDGIVDLCEMKYTKEAYALDENEWSRISRRRGALRRVLPPSKAIHVVMVTGCPMLQNAWSKEVMSFITADDFFDVRQS